MKQVMRVQWFEMKKYTGYRLLLLAGAAGALSMVYEVMATDDMGPMDAYGVLEFFRLSMFVQVLIMDMSLNLDNGNGVVMQDVTAGVSRKQILYGKILISNGVAVVLELTYTLFSATVIGAFFGFKIEGIGSILVRLFLLFLLHFRIAGEAALAAVVMKRPYIASVVYVGAFLAGRSYEMQLQGSWVSAVAVHSLLDCVSSYRVKTVYAAGGGMIDVVQHLPAAGEMVMASVGSVVIGVICLQLARRIYEKCEF